MSGLLTRKDVADVLKISVGSVSKMVKAGRLPAIKLGHRSMRFDQRDVANLLDTLATAKS